MSYLPTNSAANAFGKRCFFDDNSLMPNVYLNPAIFNACPIICCCFEKKNNQTFKKKNVFFEKI